MQCWYYLWHYGDHAAFLNKYYVTSSKIRSLWRAILEALEWLLNSKRSLFANPVTYKTLLACMHMQLPAGVPPSYQVSAVTNYGVASPTAYPAPHGFLLLAIAVTIICGILNLASLICGISALSLAIMVSNYMLLPHYIAIYCIICLYTSIHACHGSTCVFIM